ncbi:MAG TPA: methylated-DNA--[protein]-cysteine S-methyltransferase [Terracidiphilus sp.]|jgi:methylated-DNA-[protein]-cysteine S-methyltransferase
MNDALHLFLDHLPTPIGDMQIVADDDGNLRATLWTEKDRDLQSILARHYSPAHVHFTPARDPHGLTTIMARYFAGDLHAIDDIPVKTAGTEFQRAVWRALRNIPCGQTISYGELARRIGKPDAVRAVGTANGANPIGVVVPCHRVIGANGSLTGYGGGMHRKSWLLDHERSPRLF